MLCAVNAASSSLLCAHPRSDLRGQLSSHLGRSLCRFVSVRFLDSAALAPCSTHRYSSAAIACCRLTLSRGVRVHFQMKVMKKAMQERRE